MRIGIDARLYGPLHGGLGRYTQKLIQELEKADLKNEYVIFLRDEQFASYQPQNPNFSRVSANFRPYSLQEQLVFPKLLKSQQLDLVHFPHFNAPLFYRGKFVVTIHDLIISHYPTSRASTLNPWWYKIKLFFYNQVVKAAANRSQRVIAVSEYTKNDLVKILNIAPEKIQVIYEGVDLPKVSVNIDNLLIKLGIRNDFLLYVGSAYPHKNLERLILAFVEVLKIKKDLQLVLVGKVNYFYGRLKDLIEAEKLRGKVVLTDYLPDEELVGLYQKARAYVFPSLMEGFGLPPLEAQSHDLPVVCSDIPCLKEVLAYSALYFAPEDVNQMAEKILLILADQALRQKLIERGRFNLTRFSWSKMAQEVLSLYQTYPQ